MLLLPFLVFPCVGASHAIAYVLPPLYVLSVFFAPPDVPALVFCGCSFVRIKAGLPMHDAMQRIFFGGWSLIRGAVAAERKSICEEFLLILLV